MKVGRITGQVVATLKHEHLQGRRLLIVEPEAIDGLGAGAPTIAVDNIGCEIGERVLLVDDGSAARGLLGLSGPVRAIIVGVVDEVHTGGSNGTS